MFVRRLLQSLAAIALSSSISVADSIKLKSGDILRGTITEEDAASVTISYEAAKGIRDERKIPRAEIEQVLKEDPVDRDWAAITARLPTSDLMTAGEYDPLIQSVEVFLKAHATSMKASEGRRLLEGLKNEREKVVAGGVKLDGRWLTPEQYQREKYWVDGRIALKQFGEATKSGRSVEALRQFEKIEATYQGTTIFVRAVETAKIALSRYSAAISEAILNQPQLEKQRREGLASLSPAEKRASEDAQAAQAAAAKLRAEEEKKSGTKWFTLDPFNLQDLQAAKKVVETELARLGTLRIDGIHEQEAALRQIEQAIGEARIEDAEKALQQFSGTLSGVSYFRVLQERIRADKARLEAEKKAAAEARAEAQRRAVESVPPPPKPEEKDPLDEAINPVAKAVLESDLGKRVNQESPPPSTPNNPPPPPASNSGDSAATAKATNESPPSDSVTESTPTTAPNTSAKKKSGGGMTTVLYAVAGLLVVLLLGLLLSPIFKKKTPQEQPAIDDTQADAVAGDEENEESRQG